MSTIVRLFFDCRPAAIPWGIRTIVIDAIKLVRGRWFSSHIGKEVFVKIPTRIHRYASASVALPILIAWAASSVTSARPSLPFWRAAGPITVASVFAPDSFILFAAARLDVVVSEVESFNDMIVATVTKAQPVRVPAVCVSQRDDGQEIETLADEAFDLISHPSRYAIQEG